ncbi:MAG: methyltransferase [Candidatus Woesearchaeota archaeon]
MWCHPNVFYPHSDTILLANSVKTKKTDKILETCAGTGYISIKLAKKVKEITIADISKHAVKNINKNIELHNLKTKAKAIKCNLIPQEKYDIIVINPPYTNHTAKNVVEKSVWDKDNNTTIKFLKIAKTHLRKNGRIYLSWGKFANYDFIEKQSKNHKYKIKIVNEIKNYRIYLLTPHQKSKKQKPTNK